MSYERRYIDDGTGSIRVFVVRETRELCLYGLRRSLVPVGLGYYESSDGWALLDLVPWSEVPEDLRATAPPESEQAAL